MDEWRRRLEEVFTVIPGGEGKLLLSLAIVALLWVTRRLILRAVNRHAADPATRYRARKSTTYTIFAVGVVVLGAVWFAALRTLGTFLGLLSAGLAIALKTSSPTWRAGCSSCRAGRSRSATASSSAPTPATSWTSASSSSRSWRSATGSAPIRAPAASSTSPTAS